MMRQPFPAMALVLLFLIGCSGIGPGTVPRDRFNYNQAISTSWKEQTLLNVVKLRYADMPLFVEVASVVSGYTLESSANIAGQVSSPDAVQGDSLIIGGSGKYTDRPTITYSPITGKTFNENFLTPIPPRAVLFLIQSGWPADLIFPLTVRAINGLRSRVSAGVDQRAGDPEFYRIIALFRQIQTSGAVGMRILMEDENRQSTVLFFFRKNITPEVKAAIKELNGLLGLEPGSDEITVTYGLIQGSDREIAVLTNSMLDIMINLATQIEVPFEHVAAGYTVPSLAPPRDDEAAVARLIDIQSGPEQPEAPFVAVEYEDHWFWIDKGDFKSKRTFAVLMILMSLSETGGREGLPLVTIPAG